MLYVLARHWQSGRHLDAPQGEVVCLGTFDSEGYQRRKSRRCRATKTILSISAARDHSGLVTHHSFKTCTKSSTACTSVRTQEDIITSDCIPRLPIVQLRGDEKLVTQESDSYLHSGP